MVDSRTTNEVESSCCSTTLSDFVTTNAFTCIGEDLPIRFADSTANAAVAHSDKSSPSGTEYIYSDSWLPLKRH